MRHEEKPYKNLSEWIPLSKVVDYAAIDDSDDGGVFRKKFFNWAIRGYRKLRLNLLRDVKSYLIPVTALGTAKWPDDAQKILAVGYFDSCGNLMGMTEGELMEAVPRKTKCNCKKCQSSHTLCDAVEYERIEERVIFGITPYTNVITRSIDKKNKIYKETRQEYVLNTETNQVELQTNERTLCDVDLDECGCVKETESNVKALCGCCCTMDQYFTYNSPYWRHQMRCNDGGFAIDEGNRLIHVSAEGVKYIYVRCLVDLPIVNGQVYVPAIASETLAAWILYKRDQRRNIAVAQKQESYRVYKAERSEMRKAIFPIQIDIIENALNLVPHG